MMRALVFGATSGIGLACAKALCKDYEVIGVGRDISKVTDDKIVFVECDLTDRKALKKLLNSVSCPDVIRAALIMVFTRISVSMNAKKWFLRIF